MRRRSGRWRRRSPRPSRRASSAPSSTKASPWPRSWPTCARRRGTRAGRWAACRRPSWAPCSPPSRGQEQGRHRTGLVEPLTERELEVLRLLAAGRSNADMAADAVRGAEHGQDPPDPPVQQAGRPQPHPGGGPRPRARAAGLTPAAGSTPRSTLRWTRPTGHAAKLTTARRSPRRPRGVEPMAITLPTFTPLEDSLFLTLYARALDNRRPHPILGDAMADQIVRTARLRLRPAPHRHQPHPQRRPPGQEAGPGGLGVPGPPPGRGRARPGRRARHPLRAPGPAVPPSTGTTSTSPRSPPLASA